MLEGSEWLLIGAVAGVGVLHTIVPDHWVPITLIARQQGWTKREVARAAFIAGAGHTLSTLLIGLVVWIAGVAFATKFGNLVSTVSSVALIAFGGWIAVSSIRDLRTPGGHGHGHHGHAHTHTDGTIHGPELVQIAADSGVLELSIFEAGTPPHFRISGCGEGRVWLETRRDDGRHERFEFADRGEYAESLDAVPEPHAFDITVSIAHGDRVESYETTFAENHDHHAGAHPRSNDDDALYAPRTGGTAVLTTHSHVHRHGTASVHTHLHDHGSETWHEIVDDPSAEPPLHEHRHKRSLRTTLLLILGSSPMVEGIPAFFAAGKFGPVLIGIMAVVFAASTIATYVLLCTTSVAGLQRIRLGPLERYGEVLSGAFIALVGLAFLVFPIL